MASLRRTSALAFAVVSIVGAGCGDTEEKNDYVDQLNDLQLAYVDDVTELVSGSPPTTPDAAADVAGDLAELTQGLADDFAAVDTPEEVTDLHDQLVTQVEDISAQIEGAEEGLASGNAQEATQAATELQAATTAAQTELGSIIDQINSELQG